MNYKFPIIENITDVLPAIAGREEIVVAERPLFNVVNYIVAFTDTFPDPCMAATEEEALHWAIRRECRGMKFHPKTGAIMARPYHKFFNIGEKDETQHHVIDWSQEFIILEKMDGSMIHPVFADNTSMHLCTRMGTTDVAAQADAFVASSSILYYEFCEEMKDIGYTPIFEWCSTKQRIVLLYREDQLVLTGCRNNVTGEYLNYDAMRQRAGTYGVPVVNRWRGEVGEIEDFIAATKSKQDEEGHVFRWSSGLMMKQKNDWYCEIHRAKDEIRFEKNIIRLHLEGNLDDVIPHLLAADAERVNKFVNDFDLAIEESIHRLQKIVDDNSILDQKQFAKYNIDNYDGIERSLLFKIRAGHSALKVVIDSILDKTYSQTQVDSVRSLFGISWYDY